MQPGYHTVKFAGVLGAELRELVLGNIGQHAQQGLGRVKRVVGRVPVEIGDIVPARVEIPLSMFIIYRRAAVRTSDPIRRIVTISVSESPGTVYVVSSKTVVRLNCPIRGIVIPAAFSAEQGGGRDGQHEKEKDCRKYLPHKC
jgi:hypothetical protein